MQKEILPALQSMADDFLIHVERVFKVKIVKLPILG